MPAPPIRGERFYWRPGMRVLGIGMVGFVWLVIGVAVATSDSTTWWLAIPVLVGAGALTPWLLWQAFHVGVRETPEGLQGHEFARRIVVNCNDVARFAYQEVGMLELVVVERQDGSRSRLYGAKRLMRWAGRGCTEDFVALLNDRVADPAAASKAESKAPAPTSL